MERGRLSTWVFLAWSGLLLFLVVGSIVTAAQGSPGMASAVGFIVLQSLIAGYIGFRVVRWWQRRH